MYQVWLRRHSYWTKPQRFSWIEPIDKLVGENSTGCIGTLSWAASTSPAASPLNIIPIGPRRYQQTILVCDSGVYLGLTSNFFLPVTGLSFFLSCNMDGNTRCWSIGWSWLYSSIWLKIAKRDPWLCVFPCELLSRLLFSEDVGICPNWKGAVSRESRHCRFWSSPRRSVWPLISRRFLNPHPCPSCFPTVPLWSATVVRLHHHDISFY